MPVRAGSSQHRDIEEAPAAHAGSDHPQARRGPQAAGRGKELAEVCRHLEIAESTWHRWLAQYGGMKANDAKRLKELEAENARLKKLVAKPALDIDSSGDRRGKLLTLNRKRGATVMLRERFGVSERRACRVVGLHRSTQRLEPPVVDDDEQQLRGFLRDFSRASTRWGWRRAAKMPREVEGQQQAGGRLWRDEGLRVPYKRRKKRLTGPGSHVGAMCPIRPNALWAMDFQFDITVDGRTIKLLKVIDEYTRECPAIVVDRSIDADAVVALLDQLATERGAPGFVRFDNGPEFIAHAMADWCRFNGVAPCSSIPAHHGRTPGSSRSTADYRDELLNSSRFDSLLEARVIIEDWRIDYNINRPHTAHGDLTPTEFAQAWTITHQPEAA